MTESIHKDYLRCENCGTFVSKVDTSKDKLKAFYTYDGYWHDCVTNLNYPNIEQRGDYLLSTRVPVWYELMKSYKSNVDYLLELGCAEGSFLYYCKEKGIKNLVGVEVDSRTCDYARQQYGLNHIYPGIYPDVELPYSKYDVVAGFDILEHFIDPVSTLKHIYENLKDDGIGIFQTPRYRNDGPGWIHFKPNEHLFLFDETNVRLLFDRCGFDVVSVTKGSIDQDMTVIVKKKINVDNLSPRPVNLVSQSRELKSYEKKRIAIGLIEHFGGIVACEPVSRYVRAENPEAHITWCLTKEYKEIVVTNPFIDEVATVECLTEWIALRESGIYDEIVDLHIDGRVCPVCQVPLKKETPFRVNGENYYKVGNLLSAFSKGAGLPALDGSPNVYIDNLSINAVDEMYLPEEYVVIHTKTNELERDWNLGGWTDVVSHIQKSYKLPVIEVGNEGFLERALPGIVKFAGRTSYLQTAEIIRRAKLFIGVDGGPAHLANAVRTKGVIILGAYRNFKRYIPYSGFYLSNENASLVYSPDGPAKNVPSESVISAVVEMISRVDGQNKGREIENKQITVTTQNPPPKDGDVKIIAFYLPQFHPIPENDKWWGKGFTEWLNVIKGKPLFPGHYQPHIPADLGFYDLRLDIVLQDQAALASQYGIDGFCIWHYWFNQKPLLEKPLLNMLNNRLYSFPFCLAWANENWTRRWDGMENEVLMKQMYGSDEDLINHFNWLLPFFKDQRYLTVDGRPIFAIYRPADIPNIERMTGLWESLAKEKGFEGIYFLAIATSFNGLGNDKSKGFNGELLFQPQFSLLIDHLKNRTWTSNDGKSIIIDYEDAVKIMDEENGKFLENDDDKFVTVLPGWDNASRRIGLQAFTLRNPSPITYENWLRNEISRSRLKIDSKKKFIFINAWNEWGEGAHLEPDQKFHRKFLEATARAKNISNEYHSLVDWTYPIDDLKVLEEIIEFAENSKRLGRTNEAEHYLKWGIRIAGRLIGQLRHSAGRDNAVARAVRQMQHYVDLISRLHGELSFVSLRHGTNGDASSILQKLSSSIIAYDQKRLIIDAERLIESRKFQEAELILKEIIDSHPSNVDALNDMAVVKILENKYEDAFELLKKVIAIDPENKTASENIHVVLTNLNRAYNDIKQQIGNETSSNPSNDIERAEQFIEEKAYDQAESILNKVISSFPFNIDALIDLSVVYIMQGKTEEALKKLRTVLEIDPDNKIANENLKILEGILNNSSQSTYPTDNGIRTELPVKDDQRPLVSILIPVYNKLEFTKRCIEAIERNNDYPDYEIIIMDNGSTDGTKEYLDQLIESNQRVRVIHSAENAGFVKGCNAASEIAKGKYILFLNNDTEVQKGWLSSLVDFAETHEDCGAVGSKLVYPDGTLQEAGGIIFSDGNGWNYGRKGDPDDPAFNYIREVDYCSGASLMVRANLWKEIGGFDIRYAPAYYEDTDLCFSIRKLGYKVYYNYKSVVIHHEGTTSGTTLTEGFKRYQIINRSKFVKKWNKELKNQYGNNPANLDAASSRNKNGNVLVFDSLLPMPDRAAGSKFCHNIVTTLRNLKYHVTFVSVSPHLKDEYEDQLRQIGVETYCGDPQASNAIHGNSYQIAYDYRMLLNRKKYDAAFINFWYVAEYYIPIIRKHSPGTKIIVVTHDIHFNREMREAALKNDPDLNKKAEETKIRELRVYEESDIVWVVSEAEKELLSNYINPSMIQVVPLVEQLQTNSKGFEEREGLLFVGNFNHRPNVDGVRWFVNEVLPIVWKNIPDVSLNIVGNNPPPDLVSPESEKVVLTGYVKDLTPYLNTARVSVAPLLYGGGVKGKVLEAMGSGLPVVTTRIGAEGIRAANGEHLLVADDPIQFAKQVVSLYTDKKLWSKLSQNGRKLVQEEHSISKLEEGIRLSFQKLQNSKGSTAKTAPLTSIVFVTYNNLQYTKECVASIQKYTGTPYELIFVDNASKDGTHGYLRKLSKQMKNVKIILNPDNKGFPYACNQGIAISSGRYIVLLNSDVVVTEGWLDGMINRAESDESIGIVGPMTNRISGYQMDPTAKYSNQLELRKFAINYRKKNLNKWLEVRRVAGFCMLIKREVVDKIGGLDPLFGVGNCEDDDYCLRASKAGYRTVIAQDVFIHHYGGGSFLANGKENYLSILEKNSRVFKEKWGISPIEWWRDRKEPTKLAPVYVPLFDIEEKCKFLQSSGEVVALP